jgi:hypothetical protein
VDAIPIPSHIRHRRSRHSLALDAESLMWRLWIILPVFLVAALFLRFGMNPNPWAVAAGVTLGFFFPLPAPMGPR